MSILLDKTIRLFLDSIGKREEYEFYLERFKLDGQAAFAVIVPDYEGFAESAAVFAFDLRFLLRLGLHPVVLLCGQHAGQMADLLAAAEHPFRFVQLDLADEKDCDGVASVLQGAAVLGQIVALVDASTDQEQGLLRLVPRVTRRIHFIRAAGPLRRPDGSPLLYYQTEIATPLSDADAGLAGLVTRLIRVADGLHISVASPLNLLAELFTVKGAGCLIRRGARIRCHARIASVDRARLVALLENSFGRTFIRPQCLDDGGCLYLDEAYRCAAILEPYQQYMYLSKFAVLREARGEGLAQELWRCITEAHASIFWRSRTRNPFNQWYDRQAEGWHTEGDWRVYWRGVARQDIPDVIAASLARPLDFAAMPAE